MVDQLVSRAREVASWNARPLVDCLKPQDRILDLSQHQAYDQQLSPRPDYYILKADNKVYTVDYV